MAVIIPENPVFPVFPVFPEYPDILVLPDILVFAGLFLSQYDFIQGEAEGFEGVGAVELVEGEGVGAGR